MYQIVLNRILQILAEEMNGNCNYREDGTFKYTPFNISRFNEELEKAIQETNGKNFLDVGCGIGDKVMIAKEVFGLNATGIEIDQKLFHIADKHFFNIINCDALEFNRYDEFDIIFCYRPFKDEEKYEKLIKLIENKRKAESIFINVT